MKFFAEAARSAMLIAISTLFCNPGAIHAQVTDNLTFGPGTNPLEGQRSYFNFAWSASNVPYFWTTTTTAYPDYPWMKTQPSGTEGLKRLPIILNNTGTECYEITTSSATTGLPYLRLWMFQLSTSNWKSISNGATNFARVFIGPQSAPWMGLFAASSSSNSRDFNVIISRIGANNTMSASTCQVAGKPFADLTRTGSDGFYYTANTN